MPDKILSVKGLSKKYALSQGKNQVTNTNLSFTEAQTADQFWALKDVSFDLFEGDVIGIIGKNGSGKSTLLKILSRIVRPTYGIITVNRDVTSILEIGSGFHPDLTGMENIFFYGRMLDMSSPVIKSRIDEIVDFSGIGSFIHEPVKNYSNGMYLRLALAVAFHSDVKILLLDEVLSVGDAEFKLKTYDKIQDAFLNKGVSVIMVSHGMNEVAKFCNRCLTFDKGHIIFDGNPADAVSNYMEASVMGGTKSKEALSVEHPNAWHWTNMHTAPGNQEIRLCKVSLRAKEFHPGNELYIEDNIEVEIQFWKLKAEMTIQISLLFYDMFDNPIFYAATVHNLSGEPFHMLYAKDTGLISFICELPRNFMNKSIYSMQVRFGRDTISEAYLHKELFRFKISQNPEKFYYEINPPVLRPSFPWRHEKISSL